MASEPFVGLLQFGDGLLPVGAYAHSLGLESYVAANTIRDADGLESFLLAQLQGSVAPCEVVAMLASRRAVLETGDAAVARCFEIDCVLDAMKNVTETREASRQMGRQVLRIANNLGAPFSSVSLIAELLRAIEREETPGHHAMAFGAVGAVAGWPGLNMSCAYLYSFCSGLIAAALRLLPLGQLAGQRVLWKLRPVIAGLADESLTEDIAEIWTFAPALEIAAMRHATLDPRLFRS